MRQHIDPERIPFDIDGVLIDSEIIWDQVNAQEMTKLEFAMTFEKSIKLFGTFPSKDLIKT